MKLLVITPDLPPDGGGIGVYTDLLVKGLLDLGDDVLVLKGSSAPSPCAGERPYRVIRLEHRKLIGKVNAINAMRLRDQMNAMEPDAVISTNWNTFGLELLLLSKVKKVPYFVVVHAMELIMRTGSIRQNLKQKLMKKILTEARGVVTVSNYTKSLVVRIGISEDKVRVVHNGIDSTKMIPSPSSRPLRSSLDAENARVLLTVSRIEEYKGIQRVLEVLGKIEEKAGRVIYIVVGEGPFRPQLERQASRLNLQGNVVFTGRVSDEELLDYYNLCDIFILPTLEKWDDETGELLSAEGFGLVLAEASSCGKPVIAGRSGGTSEVIEDGVTGCLVDPDAREDLLEKTVRILTNEELAKELGRNGRAKAEREFHFMKKVREIRSLIESFS